MPDNAGDADANNRAGMRHDGIGYLGGVTLYTITLDGGAIWRATLANTMRRADDASRPAIACCVIFAPADAVVLTR